MQSPEHLARVTHTHPSVRTVALLAALLITPLAQAATRGPAGAASSPTTNIDTEGIKPAEAEANFYTALETEPMAA